MNATSVLLCLEFKKVQFVYSIHLPFHSVVVKQRLKKLCKKGVYLLYQRVIACVSVFTVTEAAPAAAAVAVAKAVIDASWAYLLLSTKTTFSRTAGFLAE